ncbi:MAG: hypothetical protein KGL77_02345 [Actinomycetales bacterium]|nr:hypothetical protein [Actinomycetales bacterium]
MKIFGSLMAAAMAISLAGCASFSSETAEPKTDWCASVSSDVKEIDDAGTRFLFGYDVAFPDGWIGTDFDKALGRIMVKEGKPFSSYDAQAEDLKVAMGSYYLAFLGTKTSTQCVSSDGNDLVAFIAESVLTNG